MNYPVTLAVLIPFAPLFAGSVSFEIEAGKPASINLPWASDDAAYKCPPDYSSGKPPGDRVIQSVILENIGNTSLKNWSLEINGKDTLQESSMCRWLSGGQTSGTLNSLWQLYDRWNSVTHHGGSLGHMEFSDPWGIVNLWGESLCCWDAWAFASLVAPLGIKSRMIPMNQHELNEYFVDGKWMVLDTDQDLYYPGWDGITPASFQELKDDPFLVLRAKAFGKRTSWSPSAAWWNLSLFDFSKHEIFPRSSKRAVRLKRFPYALPEESSIAWWRGSNGLASVRVTTTGASYDRENEEYKATDPYSRFTGFAEQSPSGSKGLMQGLQQKGAGQSTPCSENSFPMFRSGENTVLLKCIPQEGKARITVQFSDKAASLALPSPPVLSDFSEKSGAVLLKVDSPGASEWWWQISPDNDFLRIPPNFDRWEESPPDHLAITNPVEQTFFLPNTKYSARAKSCVDGRWSAWSKPLVFTVTKPATPQILSARSIGDSVLLEWKPMSGRMLLFGSDRADFIPDVLLGVSSKSATLRHGVLVQEWEKDSNLMLAVDAERGSATVPFKNFYRLLLEDGGIYSCPSPMIRATPGYGEHFPKGKILSRSKLYGNEGDVVARPVDFP